MGRRQAEVDLVEADRKERLLLIAAELAQLETAVRRTYGRAAAPEIRASLRRLDALRRADRASEKC